MVQRDKLKRGIGERRKRFLASRSKRSQHWDVPERVGQTPEENKEKEKSIAKKPRSLRETAESDRARGYVGKSRLYSKKSTGKKACRDYLS